MEGPPTRGNTATQEANGTAPAPAATPEPTATAKKKLKRSTRIGLSIIAVLALLAAIGFGAAYFLYSRNFVTTDNAQVDGDKIQINAPVTGTLTDWDAGQGAQVEKNQPVGRIKIQMGMGNPSRPIKSPGNGTVAVDNGVVGTWVTQGTKLATAYDFNKIFVTARVDETDIGDVRPGALVDIDVDAYSNAKVTGVVQEVQGAAADQFSLFPESNSTGNFQKVTQVIPVKIALTSTGSAAISPGMNVTVHIHK